MNKGELNLQLAEQEGISVTEAEKTVELFFNSIMEALSSGDRVEIRGLCSFKIKTYKSYTGHNPKTGEAVTVESKKLPFFRPGKNLKKRVDRS